MEIDWTGVPLPDPGDVDFAPFWEATRDGHLVVRQCMACDRLLWPPRAACKHCGSLELSWSNVSGLGELFTWTVLGHTSMKGFKGSLPFAVCVVELIEAAGLRFVARMDGSPIEDLRMGVPMQIGFEKIDEKLSLPYWRISV